MVLGIDTSCYTTSVSIVCGGEIVADERIMLDVKQGTRGLRQSEAVFMHIKNLPELFERVLPSNISAVCVSKTPRRAHDSYMPVFMAGVSFARAVATSLNVPLEFTTHQEGHIEAALRSSGFSPEGNFLAVHISGGTTEILFCKPDNFGYDIEIVGKTLDIPAGQLIDRIGVASGLKFPCGNEMGALAEKANFKLPVTVKGTDIHFTGAETAALRGLDINGGENTATRTYGAVFECVGTSLKKALICASDRFGSPEILMAGGVAGNTFIRDILTSQFNDKIHFAPPKYSSDNSVGVAFIGEKRV